MSQAQPARNAARLAIRRGWLPAIAAAATTATTAAATTATVVTAVATTTAATAAITAVATTTAIAAVATATAATTTTESAGATTTAAAAGLALFGLIDAKRAAVDRLAVHAFNCALRVFRGPHGDEREAARAASFAVGNQVDVVDVAEIGERGTDAVSSGVEREITNVKTSVHRSASIRARETYLPAPEGAFACSKAGSRTPLSTGDCGRAKQTATKTASDAP